MSDRHGEREPKGLWGKYRVFKVGAAGTLPTGEEIDGPFFVLRYDRDIHARAALRAYRDSVADENEVLAADIRRMLVATQGDPRHAERPRDMFEVGVEGDLFHLHFEGKQCEPAGCVPATIDTKRQVRERDAAILAEKGAIGTAIDPSKR